MGTVYSRQREIVIAQNEKIDRLLVVFEAHVAAALHKTAGELDRFGVDAPQIAKSARDTLNGEQVTITTPHGTKETFKFWNVVADLAGLPETRYPSVATIEMLVRRLDRRVQDMHLTSSDLFHQIAVSQGDAA